MDASPPGPDTNAPGDRRPKLIASSRRALQREPSRAAPSPPGASCSTSWPATATTCRSPHSHPSRPPHCSPRTAPPNTGSKPSPTPCGPRSPTGVSVSGSLPELLRHLPDQCCGPDSGLPGTADAHPLVGLRQPGPRCLRAGHGPGHRTPLRPHLRAAVAARRMRPLVVHYFRWVFVTRGDDPLPPTGLLGPGGAAADTTTGRSPAAGDRDRAECSRPYGAGPQQQG